MLNQGAASVHFASGLRPLLTAEEGVTAIEYGLIAALMAVAIITSLSLVGNEVESMFNAWTTAVQTAVKNAGS